MKLAVCGYPPMALQIVEAIKNVGVECKYFISDLATSHGETKVQLPSNFFNMLKFSEFRKLIKSEELDGLIIAELLPDTGLSRDIALEIVKLCKFYNIPNVHVRNNGSLFGMFYCLNSEKSFIPYLETNLIDSCNLNCKACTHYSNLFNDDDFYKVEDFRRDIRQLADQADILRLRLLGGEPLKLKNLDEYLKISRSFLPHTNIRVVTNGLLIPTLSQKILDSLRENQIAVDISLYPPTLRVWDKITGILKKNNVFYEATTGKVETFYVFLTLHDDHNPEQARAVCYNDVCRFLRDGKIYKCPTDALSFRFVERFGLKNFPLPTSVDIFAKNFPAQMEKLDGNIELCTWCNETTRKIKWTPENNPKLSDWLVNPAETENLLQK